VVAEFNRNTEQAIAADVFGVPWYRVDGEGFWGQDRLEFVERSLQND
jgi:2-hydroxychromene-2-carboxylate isomerase